MCFKTLSLSRFAGGCGLAARDYSQCRTRHLGWSLLMVIRALVYLLGACQLIGVRQNLNKMYDLEKIKRNKCEVCILNYKKS